MEMYWTSPLYDGVTHYPYNDYVCTLTITIPAAYMMFMVNMELMEPSHIYETNACSGDNLLFTPSTGAVVTSCGDIESHSWTETTIFDGPKTFSFTWTSVAADGGTDVGFKIKISGHNLMGKK